MKDAASISKGQVLRELARRIEQLESRRGPVRCRRVATGIPLHGLWPGGGLRAGTLVELFSAAAGGGAWTLGLVMAVNACGEGKTLVLVDGAGQLYPPAAVRWGLDLNRSIVVRPGNRGDAYQAIVQSLRCRAVGAVLGWQERLSVRESRRLQLAAETGGGIAILLRPRRASRAHSCAAVRLLVSPESAGGELFCEERRVRRVRVEVLRCRGARPGQSLVLEIDDEAGDVRPFSGMAAATAAARSARASG